MASEKQLSAALDLLQHLPTSSLGQYLTSICKLQPDLTEDLLSEVDQPLKTMKCPKSGNEFIICDHNRDGDSFRSPWSNEYNPPNPDGVLPSTRLRKLEVLANDAFEGYKEAYYDSGLASVYMWDLDTGFAAAVLIRKEISNTEDVNKGVWDSVHVIEVEETPESRKAKYTITSCIMLGVAGGSGTSLNLSGRITSQTETTESVAREDDHITNIGNLVQDVEGRIRGSLDLVYFGKAVEITGEVRSKQPMSAKAAQGDLASALAARFGKK